MGHHINSEGRFQSDKYPDLPPDKIVLSFKDPRARNALIALAADYQTTDPDLSDDIAMRMWSLGFVIVGSSKDANQERSEAK